MVAKIGLFAATLTMLTARSIGAQPESAPPPPAPQPSEPAADSGEAIKGNKLQVGVRIGANFASVPDAPSGEPVESRTALSVGAFGSYEISRMLSVELGVGYSQRGYRFDDFFGAGDTVIELDYFEAPVRVNARIPIGSRAHGRIFGGLSVLLLDAARSRSNGESMSIEGQVADYDVAILAGVGLDLAVDEWIFIGELRYDVGLVNTAENDGGFNVFNRVAALLAGIAF